MTVSSSKKVQQPAAETETPKAVQETAAEQSIQGEKGQPAEHEQRPSFCCGSCS